MFIKCKFPQVNVFGINYTNRRINLANIVMMDKSTAYNKDTNTGVTITAPSIKFTSIATNKNGSSEIYEWVFESIVDRDATMDDIDAQLDYRINK